MEQERDKAWEAEDERFVAGDPDNRSNEGAPAVPDVEVPLEANPADALEQELTVPAEAEEER